MNCGLVFSSPRLKAESAKNFYRSDIYRRLYEAGGFRENFNAEYDMATDYDFRPFKGSEYRKLSFIDYLHDTGIAYQSVCEIGAGGGTNLVPFNKMDKNCIGYEYSEQLTQLGRDKGLDLIQGTINDLTHNFDLIILIHVLEHFLDPIQQLRQLKRHVHKHLFIEIPGIITKLPLMQNAHNYYFSVNTLLRCTSLSGFRFVDLQIVPENDYILALFDPKGEGLHEYNHNDEVKKMLKIIRTYKIINYTSRIIKNLPFGKYIHAILNNLFQHSSPYPPPSML